MSSPTGASPQSSLSAGPGAMKEISRHAKTPWWKSRRTRRVLQGSVLVLLLGIVIWWFYFHPFVSTDDARVAGTMVRVAPQGVSGRIEKLNVDDGSAVKKGDVLLELDHSTTEAQLARAKANASLATEDLRRAEQLAAQHGLTPRDLDKAHAQAATAEAELKLAQVNYDNTFLRSPLDGVVVKRIAEVGNILEPGQTAIVVADVEHAWISANVEETAVGDVRLGQPVTVKIDEGGRLTGKVSEITQAAAAQFALIPADNAAGNFTKLVQRIPIKVELDAHPDRALRIGQSVEIKVRVR